MRFKLRINKYWQKLFLCFVILKLLEFLIDGRSEAFVHDVVLTGVIGSFFIIFNSISSKENNDKNNKE